MSERECLLVVVEHILAGTDRTGHQFDVFEACRLVLRTWNIISLVGKEPELVREVVRYQLDLIGLTSTHSGSGNKLLERGWTLSFSGDAQRVRCQAGVGILTIPQCHCVLPGELVG